MGRLLIVGWGLGWGRSLWTHKPVTATGWAGWGLGLGVNDVGLGWGKEERVELEVDRRIVPPEIELGRRSGGVGVGVGVGDGDDSEDGVEDVDAVVGDCRCHSVCILLGWEIAP